MVWSYALELISVIKLKIVILTLLLWEEINAIMRRLSNLEKNCVCFGSLQINKYSNYIYAIAMLIMRIRCLVSWYDIFFVLIVRMCYKKTYFCWHCYSTPHLRQFEHYKAIAFLEFQFNDRKRGCCFNYFIVCSKPIPKIYFTMQFAGVHWELNVTWRLVLQCIFSMLVIVENFRIV